MEIPSDMRSREESKGKIEKEKVKRDWINEVESKGTNNSSEGIFPIISWVTRCFVQDVCVTHDANEPFSPPVIKPVNTKMFCSIIKR